MMIKFWQYLIRYEILTHSYMLRILSLWIFWMISLMLGECCSCKFKSMDVCIIHLTQKQKALQFWASTI